MVIDTLRDSSDGLILEVVFMFTVFLLFLYDLNLKNFHFLKDHLEILQYLHCFEISTSVNIL